MNNIKKYLRDPLVMPLVMSLILFFLVHIPWNYHIRNSTERFFAQETNKNNYQYDLVQISNTKDINGHISFLGNGIINQKSYYYVYIKKDDGIQLLKLQAENKPGYKITICQDSQNSYIKSKYNHIENLGWVFYFDHYKSSQDIEIHIPPGSMVQNIDINSENFK